MSLKATIDIYRAAHGEPEYRYFKKWIVYAKERRKPGYHSRPIGDGQECSREEYEANVEECKRLYGEAFMGRLPKSYWDYGRKMIKDGWRERLIKDVETFDDAADSSGVHNSKTEI